MIPVVRPDSGRTSWVRSNNPTSIIPHDSSSKYDFGRPLRLRSYVLTSVIHLIIIEPAEAETTVTPLGAHNHKLSKHSRHATLSC
jgi:hypothetical protein